MIFNSSCSRDDYGAAITTLLGAGAELAAPNRSAVQGTVVIATQQSLQDTVNQVGQEMTRRNLDIQPTLTERLGLPLRVIVNRDILFPLKECQIICRMTAI